MRYDQEFIPLFDQVIMGINISLNEFDGVIFGIDNNKNSSHASLLSEGGTCSTHDGQTNLRTWKRIIRQTHTEDNPMTGITQTGTPQTGKRASGSRDDSQSEFPCKKLQVLKMDGKTNTVMVEVASQSCQSTMSCLFWNCHGLENLYTEEELGDLIRAKDPSMVFLAETLADEARLKQIKEKINFPNLFFVERNNKGGGLELYWRNSIDLDVDTYLKNYIDAIVNKGKEDAWRLTGFYSEPVTHKRYVS